jgi:putative ABC transport system permease protein
VSIDVLEDPSTERLRSGGFPARRAVVRWGVRLLRREWKQQLLIFALITAAVAATFIASAVATATPATAAGTLGSAQDAVSFTGTSSRLTADIAAVRQQFGQVDVIESQDQTVPGSVQTFTLRAQDPHGPFGQPLLSLVSGSYPAGAGQVAMTSGLASDLHLSVGSTWTLGGVSRTVVGIVENPQSLLDEFALVAPGQVTSPDQVTVLFNGNGLSTDAISAKLPSGSAVSDAQSVANQNAVNPETISLAAAILGMLLIALVGVGGFSVLAQRRLRSIGMLAAQGATAQNIRLVVRANGAATGVAGAVAGFLIGMIGWLLYRPTAQSSAHHVIGVFQLPWTVIIVSMVLAVLATYFAASRPAKAISRVPVVAALSGRPPAPKKAGRLVIPIGTALLVLSFILLGLAGAASGTGGGGGGNPLGEVGLGLILLAVGVIMLAPTTLGVVAWLGNSAPISMRLALRDLSRYRARSGPALAAIALSTLIAVIVCVESAGRFANNLDYAGPNLTSSQLVVYTAAGPYGGSTLVTPGAGGGTGTAVVNGRGPTRHGQGSAGQSDAGQGDAGQGGQSAPPTPSVADQAKVADQIAKSLGNAGIITLYSTSVGLTHAAGGRSWSGPIYLATPQLLQMFGISASEVNPDADILTTRPGLSTESLMQLTYGQGKGGPPPLGGNVYPCPAGSCLANPPIQEVGQLPSGTSAPNTVVTEHAIATLHQQSSISTSGWLIQVPGGLTAAEIRGVQQAAAAAGMTVETRNSIPSLETIVNDATVFGILLALAILGMSVGLVRSEASKDLRTLSATGASGITRCILVATTAGALGFTGALIGIAGGYLAAIGFARSNQLDGLSSLNAIPVGNLLLILVGMPLIAALVAGLLAAREPSTIARQPLE